MAHIYKAEEWESAGFWHCGDVSRLSAGSNSWWYVPRMLKLSMEEYIYLLKDKFHATNFNYSAKYNVLSFSFKTQAECRKFKNYINKIAREKNFVTY